MEDRSQTTGGGEERFGVSLFRTWRQAMAYRGLAVTLRFWRCDEGIRMLVGNRVLGTVTAISCGLAEGGRR